jgi:stress response protein YsnF
VDVNLTDEEQDTLASHYGEPTRILSGDTGPEAEMVRSEEEVEFGVTPARPRERVRLRKHTVVEHVEKTVPVRREEIRLEHEPPPDGKIVDVEDA